jgi:hypothetical protein
MMSSRCGLAANPKSAACEVRFYYVSYSHFDQCLRLCGCIGHHDVIKLIPLYVII